MTITPENLLADFLEQDETAAELGICRRTLDRWRQLGEGPPITKLGRRILYRRSSLLAWIRGREHHQEGEAGESRTRHRRARLRKSSVAVRQPCSA
jgi:hypothetical protein